MTKISELPIATMPLTGSETLPSVNGSVESRASVGQSQVLEPLGGDLPTNRPVGAMAFGVGIPGGDRPIYNDGAEWRVGGGTRPVVNTMGLGLWMVACGVPVPNSPAEFVQSGKGFYFVSANGYDWDIFQFEGMDRSFRHVAYANGCWLAEGHTSVSGGAGARVATNTDPRQRLQWNSLLPYGFVGANGTTPDPPTAYDNSTGKFTVPIFGGSTQEIQNPLPSAVIPDQTWPHIGQNLGGTSVLGMGTSGPVEVRIASKQIKITRFAAMNDTETGAPLDPAGFAGIYTSMFVQSRQAGTSDYSSLTVRVITTGIAVQTMLGGNSANSAGLNLRGLVWGPLKQTAVRFPPGGT